MRNKGKKALTEEEKKLDELTVAEMNVEGMPWYKTPEEIKHAKEMDELKLSKQESRAMIKGAYAAYIPAFLIGLGVFSAAFGLIMLYFYLVTH